MLIIEGYKNPELFFVLKKMVGDFVINRKKGTDIAKYIKNAFKAKYGRKGQLRAYKKSFITIRINDAEIGKAVNKIFGEFKANSKSFELHIIIDNKIIILDRTMSKEAMLKKLKATE